jgi:RNA polymerase sigma-70 factor (ECF subfamily)
MVVRTSGPSAATLEARDLTRPDLRRALIKLARRIAPAHEAEDIVQESIVDALTTRSGPRDRANLEAWMRAIVRHRVSDYYRRSGREQAGQVPEGQVEPDEGDGRELLRWAEEALPGGRTDQQTFEWLLEEADGEHLEAIARREQMPSDRVRQRVTRLRRHLREQWALELAAVGVMLLVGYGLWSRLRAAPIEASRDLTPQIGQPTLAPAMRAQRLRNTALELCRTGEHRACLDGLDQAAALDPSGDGTEVVQMARREAEKALSPPPTPAPIPSAGGAGPGANRFGRVTSGPRPASDTAPSAPHRCVCPKGDPLCSCF